MEHGKPLVLNKPTAKNVIGFTVIWLGLLVLIFLAGIILGPYEWSLWRIVASVLVCSFPMGILTYILFSGGKSVTVMDDRMLVELWISELFHLKKVTSIRWNEIQHVRHIINSSPKGRIDRIVLTTPNGQIGFSDVCFDHLGSLRNVLVEKLGKDRITVRGKSRRS